MRLRVCANTFRPKRTFVGVASKANLLVRRVPPCRTRSYAYVENVTKPKYMSKTKDVYPYMKFDKRVRVRSDM